ncbi:hypothetical protein Tco_0345811 [Tanacetum coccineum]
MLLALTEVLPQAIFQICWSDPGCASNERGSHSLIWRSSEFLARHSQQRLEEEPGKRSVGFQHYKTDGLMQQTCLSSFSDIARKELDKLLIGERQTRTWLTCDEQVDGKKRVLADLSLSTQGSRAKAPEVTQKMRNFVKNHGVHAHKGVLMSFSWLYDEDDNSISRVAALTLTRMNELFLDYATFPPRSSRKHNGVEVRPFMEINQLRLLHSESESDDDIEDNIFPLLSELFSSWLNHEESYDAASAPLSTISISQEKSLRLHHCKRLLVCNSNPLITERDLLKILWPSLTKFLVTKSG